VRATIVGGGIRGLAAAVALRRLGFEAVVALRDALIAATPAGVQVRQQAQVIDYDLPEL
jgi:glycine/D-amino acid oxidase-like deaminating enzyme